MTQSMSPVRCLLSICPSVADLWRTVLIKGLEGKNIVQIACGQQHSVAMDSEG